MNTITQTFKQIGFFTIALTLALVANFAYGQWTNPTAAPVGDNVAVPINESGRYQEKPGTLGLSQLRAGDRVRSDLFCDFDDIVCLTAADLVEIKNIINSEEPTSGGSSGPQLYSCPVSPNCRDITSTCVGQVSQSETCRGTFRDLRRSDGNQCSGRVLTCTPITNTPPPPPPPSTQLYQCPRINSGCTSECIGQLSTETTCSYIQEQGSDGNCSYPGANRTATCTPI